jgi:hypothetical protein
MIGIFVLFLAFPAQAGWVIKEKDGEISYLSEGKIKVVTGAKEDRMWYIMDSKSGLMTLVDEERKVYASGKPDEYCEASKSLGEEMKEAMMKKMSPEEREMFEKYMKGTERPEEGKRPTSKKPAVTIEKTGSEVIAGYKTSRYTIKVDGEKFEDVWIATDVSLDKEMKEIESGMLAMQKRFEKCAGPVEAYEEEDGPGSSPEYEKLMSEGFVMKEISYMGGHEEEGEVVSEVMKLEKKNIPPSEFSVPSGYKRLSLKELFRGQIRREDDFDD